METEKSFRAELAPEYKMYEMKKSFSILSLTRRRRKRKSLLILSVFSGSLSTVEKRDGSDGKGPKETE